MKTSHVSSPIRNRIRLLVYVIAIAYGVSQASAQQSAARLSRTGVHAPIPDAIVHAPISQAKSGNSPLYTFTFGLIDYPRSQVSGVWGINDSGKMVGGYNDENIEDYGADHAYVLKGNTFSTIDYPGALGTEFYAVNKSGEMVGTFTDTSGNIHGFKLAGGIFTQLDYPGVTSETVAIGINSSGEIVGIYQDPNTGYASGFMLSGTTYTSIVVPGALATYVGGINKAGVIAGYYFDTSSNSHGFTYNKGTITTIDYGNGYPNTYLNGISDAGLMVGGYGSLIKIGSLNYPWEHGFLYSGGVFSTFDAPFGDVQVTQPWGLNNKGEIVGDYLDSQGMSYGFYAKATP